MAPAPPSNGVLSPGRYGSADSYIPPRGAGVRGWPDPGPLLLLRRLDLSLTELDPSDLAGDGLRQL